MVGNGEDAADALQNTMAAVLRGLEGETREIALKAWMFRIAHNESLSILRRRRPQHQLDESQPSPAASLESGVLLSERLRQVVADVQALPERQRGALVMRELTGLEYGEIAAVFSVSEGAARQAVHEARTMLHEISEGRAMACADVQELIDARDGRLLRGRKVRAHLRACDSCSRFRAAIDERRSGLAAVAPPLSAPLAASMLEGLLGGGHGGGAAATAAGHGVAAASAAPVAKTAALTAMAAKTAGGASIVAKALAVTATTAALAGGVVVAEQQIDPFGQSQNQQPASASKTAVSAGASGAPATLRTPLGVDPSSHQVVAAETTADRSGQRTPERQTVGRRAAGGSRSPHGRAPTTAGARRTPTATQRAPERAATVRPPAPSVEPVRTPATRAPETTPEPSTPATRPEQPSAPVTAAPESVPSQPAAVPSTQPSVPPPPTSTPDLPVAGAVQQPRFGTSPR